MKESQQKVAGIIKLMDEHYPDLKCPLDHKSPFQLMVATILSAQCTDERVNKTTPELFRKFPDPKTMAAAPIDELENLVRSTGFFRNKAKNLKAASAMIMTNFGGKMPETLEDMTTLPGVARKTANVVLGYVHNIPGVVVDTHVKRLSLRIGFTNMNNPEKIEQELMNLWPKSHWSRLSRQLIEHGRKICKARKPVCADCFLNTLCDYTEKEKA
jgi:endonuclease-3